MIRRVVGLLAAGLLAAVPAAIAPQPAVASESQHQVATSAVALGGIAPAFVPAAIDSRRPLVVVLDLSGSMRDDDGTGTNKLIAAKSSVERVIRSQAGSSVIGVWGYPSNSDCDPGRYIIEPQSITDIPLAIATVDAMAADGGTPTGLALSGAVDGLKARGYSEASIILISDGESNCSSPPCEVAQSLVNDGFDITVDAVGFQQSEAGRTELQCVADATHGRYIDVNDGDSLIENLDNLSARALQLTIDETPTTAWVGTTVQVTATVTNTSAKAAVNVRANLSFLGTSSDISTVVIPPTVSLGSLPPGEHRTYTWQVTTSAQAKGIAKDFAVTAWGDDLAAVSERRTVNFSTKLPGTDELASLLWLDEAPGSKLVILGDSYSSGEGIGDYVDNSDKCHQSLNTYAAQQIPQERVVLIACSGAVTGNLYAAQNADHLEKVRRPQLDQLRDVDKIGSVLMTFGGNDIGFADIIAQCANPFNRNCTRNADWMRAVSDSLAGLSQTLPNAFRDIWKTANDEQHYASRGNTYAPVVVLAYPEILHDPSRGACGNFEANEVEFANRLVVALNASIKKAVETVRGEGYEVYFVPTTQSSFLPNNTACASKDKYVNDLLLQPLLKSESYHPVEAGHKATTLTLISWLQSVQRVKPTQSAAPAPNDSWLTGLNRWIDRVDTINMETAAKQAEDSRKYVENATSTKPFLISAGGYAPNSTATVTLHSAPVTLGTFPTDESGNVNATVWIPEFVPIGAHTLSVWGLDEAGDFRQLDQSIMVREPGPEWLPALVLTAAAALILGLAITVWGALRRHRSVRALRQQASVAV